MFYGIVEVLTCLLDLFSDNISDPFVNDIIIKCNFQMALVDM